LPVDSKHLPLDRGLELIAQAGFDFIELSRRHSNWLDHKKQIKNLGLNVWAVHGILGYNGISKDKQIRQNAIAKERELMHSTAIYAPCPYVIHYLNRHNDPQIDGYFRDTVSALLETADLLGFNLAIETAPYKPEENQRYPDSSEIADFVRSFNSESISICVDFNHSNLNESLPQAISNCGSLISTIHISDNHGQREEHLFPGDGTIDFKKAILSLNKTGYNGPLNIECHSDKPINVELLQQLCLWAKQM